MPPQRPTLISPPGGLDEPSGPKKPEPKKINGPKSHAKSDSKPDRKPTAKADPDAEAQSPDGDRRAGESTDAKD